MPLISKYIFILLAFNVLKECPVVKIASGSAFSMITLLRLPTFGTGL
jgi:hypothetical protein